MLSYLLLGDHPIQSIRALYRIGTRQCSSTCALHLRSYAARLHLAFPQTKPWTLVPTADVSDSLIHSRTLSANSEDLPTPNFPHAKRQAGRHLAPKSNGEPQPLRIPTELLDNNPDGLIEIDSSGAIVNWNTAAEGIFGYTRGFAIGRSAVDLLNLQCETAETMRELTNAIRIKRGRLVGRRSERISTRANGAHFPMELTLFTALDSQGTVTLTAATRDISARKAIQTLLQRSEQRFRALVEGVSEYIIHLLDANGRILTWNSGNQHLDGYCARDLVGRRFSCLYTEQDVAAGLPQNDLQTALRFGHHRRDGWTVRKDGSRYWSNVLLTVLPRIDGHPFGFSRIGFDNSQALRRGLGTVT